jgi:hypothetical protein
VGFLLDGSPIYQGERPEVTPLLAPDAPLAVVGYALDGYRVVAAAEWPGVGELDECNGRFVEGADGRWAYAYFLTANATHGRWPFAVGCWGPSRRGLAGGVLDFAAVAPATVSQCGG